MTPDERLLKTPFEGEGNRSRGGGLMEVAQDKGTTINVREQRPDAAPMFSDMALFGRTQLMVVAVKRFPAALWGHALPACAAPAEELLARYAACGRPDVFTAIYLKRAG